AARNAVGSQERCRALTGFGQDWQQESCWARGVVYTGQTCNGHAIKSAVLGNRNPVDRTACGLWDPVAGWVPSQFLRPATVAPPAAVPAAGRYT
ncbi:hypothetical protein ACLOJK_024131, partial [Asimina triloba]